MGLPAESEGGGGTPPWQLKTYPLDHVLKIVYYCVLKRSIKIVIHVWKTRHELKLYILWPSTVKQQSSCKKSPRVPSVMQKTKANPLL